jgi:hypothetical protein
MFATAEGDGTLLECPYCHAKFLDCGVQKSQRSEILQWLGITLQLSSMGGPIFVIVALVDLVQIAFSSNVGVPRWGPQPGSRLGLMVIGALACGFLFVSGRLFFQAGNYRESKGLRLLGGLFALLAAATLLTILAFILKHQNL